MLRRVSPNFCLSDGGFSEIAVSANNLIAKNLCKILVCGRMNQILTTNDIYISQGHNDERKLSRIFIYLFFISLPGAGRFETLDPL